MAVEPADRVLMTPDAEPIVATVLLLLDQTPPDGVPLSVCDVVAHTGVDMVNVGTVLTV